MSSDYQWPPVVSHGFTQVGIAASLSWLSCSWRDGTVRVNLSSWHQDTIKATAGPGPDVETPHSPQDKPEGCNGWSPRDFPMSLALLFVSLVQSLGKNQARKGYKMEKSKHSENIHDSATGNHIVEIRKKWRHTLEYPKYQKLSIKVWGNISGMNFTNLWLSLMYFVTT